MIVKTVKFTRTDNGVRIKTWGRPSNEFVKNVLFQHVAMASGLKVSDVTYQDIHGTSATEVAVKFDCSSKNPCSGIKLQDVKLTYSNQIAEASCQNAGGTSQGYLQPESCL
ncbi:hypothetical protein QN277_019525 [Acacia crassicarpa]|uniref:Polygalacturonase n=1 Tax=Acacia crassicarpa TaxID=499986 RepID=A0AAE1JKZ4_9FABA|nr:hypothetical protein QN277_019525 [Acacia crassicarpa]